MGAILSKRELNILMIGLQDSGKTSIIYKMKNGEKTVNLPTSVNVEDITIENIKYNLWEIGGKSTVKPLWNHYSTNKDGLIFTVDSTDRENIEEAGLSLYMISDEKSLANTSILIYANKQDLDNAMTIDEIKEKMKLEERFQNRTWTIFPCSAVTGEGLEEGLKWLGAHMN